MPATVGVLALQGAFEAHQLLLETCDVRTRQVRAPDDLDRVDALVMPGGESTTMSRLLTTSGLFDPLAARIGDGMPVFGTCAGMILLASEVLDGRTDQRSFGAIDITVRRNGYGRQRDSFEAELYIKGLSRRPAAPLRLPSSPPPLADDSMSFHGVFIRAPKVERVGEGVEVLAEHEGVPVLLRSGRVSVASFHPELAGDPRLHQQFVAFIQPSPNTYRAREST